MKVGIYGGTFDPIHFGHLSLVLSLQEAHQLDEVWFVPAARSPHKEKGEVDGAHRLAMVERAIEGMSSWKALPNEIDRPPPSYMIDTLEELSSKGHDLSLLLGDDSLERFAEWKGVNKIIETFPLLVGRRHEALDLSSLQEPIRAAVEAGLTPTPLMEISATVIRERLKKDLYVECWIPGKVLDYIRHHRLYS